MHVHAYIKASPFEIMFGTKMHSRPEDRLLVLLDRDQKTQFIQNLLEMHKAAKLGIHQEQQEVKSRARVQIW